MAKQTINIGTAPNSRNGDPIRTAFNKTNQNFTELYNAMPQTPEWLNPGSSNTWSIVTRSGGIRVNTSTPDSEDVVSTITSIATSSSFYIPRDETTQRIQDYWDSNVEGGYDYTRIVIGDSVEYEGFVTTYTSDGWRIQMDEPAVFEVGSQVIVRYYGNPAPVKWFDAASYANSDNFLGAVINYYAFVEGRGQKIGTIWMTSTHDEYNNFDTDELSSRSGEYTDLNMIRRPNSQNPSKSLWLATNSSTSEPVSVFWEAKMFYGEGGIVTPEIIPD